VNAEATRCESEEQFSLDFCRPCSYTGASPVPEPSSLALLGGVLTLAAAHHWLRGTRERKTKLEENV
jgi:hypothetical protein